jgi:prepilin-type N-terminal cleavage/methylation domain-containing protein
MKKNGFTLAEILVSVAIVGVIGALTLPALRTNTTEAQIGPKLAKAVSTFEQANESLLNSNSSDSLTDTGFVVAGNVETYIQRLGAFLKMTLTENNNFTTKDNMSFTFEDVARPDNTEAPAHLQRIGDVIININTGADRDVDGTNLFYFSWWNDGSLRPKGSINWKGGADEDYSVDPEEWGNMFPKAPMPSEGASDRNGGSEHWRTQCNIGVAPEDATFCAGHIFENNLRVLYE